MSEQRQVQLEVERVDKPWGEELILCRWNGYLVKLLRVNEGARTSRQYHREKHEWWFYEDGGYREVLPGQVHRLTGPCEVLEVAYGDNGDVVRVEDDYGRV